MMLIDRLRTGFTGQRRTARIGPGWFSGLERHAPAVVALAVGAGVMFLIATTPTASGDYGQWLMTSRHYLGQEVPDYRNIAALPPLVSMLLAAIRVVIPDPLVALHVLNALLLAGLGASFYLLGVLVLGSRWVGALSVVIGLFATDRFLELFAFGGLLQLAAMTFTGVSVAAFARAGRGPGVVRRWWLIGTAALACAALSHTATGSLAIVIGILAVGLAAARQRGVGWRPLAGALAPLGAMLVGIAAYWLLVLLPANADYLTNPASLAYRGPDRLFSPMIGQWPSALLLIGGTLTLAIGGVQALLRRRLDGWPVLVAWVAVTWGALVVSMISQTGTDYPRLATPMLTPLVVAAAAGAVWLLGGLASYVRRALPSWPRNALIAVMVMGTVIVTAPMVVARHAAQANYYDLRDADALSRAVAWLDTRLGADRPAVLAEVREGKWIEGLSGREALFSQPVRYAFREVEWQRSLDADTLLRSTVAITSGLIGAFFTDRASYAGRTAPTGLVVRANHGGELVDLLRLSSSTILTQDGAVRAASLVPVREVESVGQRQVSLSSVWADRQRTFAMTQSITVWRDGSTLRMTQHSSGNRLQVTLGAVGGMSITSFVVSGQEAKVCFTKFGDSQPCLRIWVSQADATLALGSDGAIRVASSRSDRLEILITALTAGEPSVAVGIVSPRDVVEGRDIGAALLYSEDAAYEARARRLETLGFREAYAAGPYRVLLRETGQ